MSQLINMQPKGLVTFPNILSEVKQGNLSVADNIVIDKPGIINSRRGNYIYGSIDFTPDQIRKLFNYDNTLQAYGNDTLYWDANGDGTVWTAYTGTLEIPSGAVTVRSVESNENAYYTSSTGIQKLDAVNAAALMPAGSPKALGGTGATTGASGFLANNSQCAYRVVWGFTDANDNLILGSPSQRIVVSNTSGGTRDVALTFDIPDTITTSWFYQLYRSLQTSTSVVPNDELYLVYEANPTAGEIAAASVTVTDSTPESLMGATLYTSPSQEGIAGANDQPPFCTDMCLFQNHMFYSDTRQKQRIQVSYIGGLALNDTITIDGTVYTAKVAENAALGEFQLFTGGSPAQDIEDTALSLVKVINQYATNTTVYAYYLSGYNDLPGQMLFEERAIGGAAFNTISSNGNAWIPDLTANVASSNDAAPNRIAISKPGQPEAVPILQFVIAGSKNFRIQRIVPLRESVMVFKPDGIFRITGTDIASFQVSPLDYTTQLLADETAVALNNQVFCMTDSGVVAVSDTGVGIASRDIEQTLLQLSDSAYTNFPTASFAVAYESDRKYIFYTVTDTADTVATQAYVYNFLTNAWTRWDNSRSCGIVNSGDGKLYMGEPSTGDIYVERKTFTRLDYADLEVDITIGSSSGTTVTVTSTAGVSAGWTLKQSYLESVIVSVTDATHFVVTDSLSWTAGAAIAYEPIAVLSQFVPQTCKNPGVMKHFRELTAMFTESNFSSVAVGFKTESSPYLETTDISPAYEGGWGMFPWGGIAWGGVPVGVQAIRTYVPLEKTRGLWIDLSMASEQAFNSFDFGGYSMVYTQASERFF